MKIELDVTPEQVENLGKVFNWLIDGLGPGGEDYTDQFASEYEDAWHVVGELKESVNG